jgi:hypothetical protein
VLPVQGERQVARRILLFVAACAALAGSAAPALARGAAPARSPAIFDVGAAKANVTPSAATLATGQFYNGGYGIGPVHPAHYVVRPIYFRVIAIRDRNGNQAVIGAIDSQGYSVAYQNGPYGFRDIENDIQAKLGIPANHIILQATHDHNGPDEIGVWGGVPDSYFAFVKQQMETAITTAVRSEERANLHLGTADMTGFSGTFGSNTDPTNTGDNADYPVDQQLRVLQAVVPGTGHAIATLVNYSTHATIYGPRDAVLPDWPGATATYLEGDEQNTQPGAHYGYPGSTAIVTVGAMGHTWPAGVPRGTDPSVDPSRNADPAPCNSTSPCLDNYDADIYGNAVAREAIGALSGGRGFWLSDAHIAATERKVYVENTNPVLLAAGNEPSNSTPLGGYKIDRAITPPWGAGDVFISPVTALRIGNLPFFSVPGEPYPSIKFSLNQAVGNPPGDSEPQVSFIFGLGQDQLGYAEEMGDYNGAFQCSTTDEWFFTISPVFGSAVVRLQRDNAKALGFSVTGSALPAYGPGALPPATNCTQQQFEQAGLPAG